MHMKTTAVMFAAAGCLLAGVASAASEAEAMDIAKKGGCLACHSLDKKLVGPAWKDVGAKYAGHADATAMLLAKVTLMAASFTH